MLSSAQWQKYLDKYEKLMWMISRRISGDPVIADIETNYADLCVAALESVKGFNKKTGEDFDEMMENPLFNQYTKTVLWNAKNKKGMYVTNRRALNLSSISSDREGNSIDFIDCGSSDDYNDCLDRMLGSFAQISKEEIKNLCDNPKLIEKV